MEVATGLGHIINHVPADKNCKTWGLPFSWLENYRNVFQATDEMAFDSSESKDIWGRYVLEGFNVPGTLAHMWWTWPRINVFFLGKKSLSYPGQEVLAEPWRALFHCTEVLVPQYKRSVLPHLLNTGKVLIYKHWSIHNILTVKERNYTCSVDKMMNRKDTLEKFDAIWKK